MKKEKTNRTFLWRQFKKNYGGYAYLIPVLVGIFVFTLLPMIVSLVYSLHDYYPLRMENQLVNFGLHNYKKIFTINWEGVSRSLFITFRYAILSVALNLTGSYILALFLNNKMRGTKFFRIFYLLPGLIPAIAGALLWKDITRVNSGYINLILEAVGLPTYTFYEAVETVLPTILITSIVGWGGSTIMWLAQMQNVPDSLYESAKIDGANYLQRTFKITLPMTTPMIFYQLITSIIAALQVFGNFYTLKNGIADPEINFIVIMIYDAAFGGGGGFGYACALSWVLFVIIGLITLFVFKTNKWVYYGEEM